MREWRLGDRRSLAENANNVRVWDNLRDYFPHPYTENDAEQFIRMVMARSAPPTDLAIVVGGKAVGGIGIVPQNDVERISAEIGYWLGEGYWNKGIMTWAIRQMTGYVFGNFPITKLYAPVFEFNAASMRALEKAGFVREGVFRQAAVKNGRVIDLHYYGLLKEQGPNHFKKDL